MSSTMMRDDTGEIKGFHGIAKDLIQFKRIPEEQIKREKRDSSAQLAAEVVHELSNPLELIAGYTKVLEKDCKEQKDVHKVLRTIEKQTKNCQKTVTDLVKLLHQSADMVPVDINNCLEDALADMELILNIDRIYVRRKKAPHLKKVRGYPEKLRKVFVNIINYERQTLQMDDTIGVWTGYRKDTGEIEIIIADTGPVVPSEVAENIFDPFFCTRKGERETVPADLGLSVSAGVIKTHQGRIELESPPGDPELIGAGMNVAFHILLPALNQKSLGAIDSGDR
jgi:signal transduction histidine kinase